MHFENTWQLDNILISDQVDVYVSYGDEIDNEQGKPK